MTIHTVRLDTITTIEQHRRDIITIITTDRRHLTITIMAIAISLAISSDLIAISRSVIMGHLIVDLHIMCHPISIAHLLTEVVDKKYNEI